jgi:hypothetical protein
MSYGSDTTQPAPQKHRQQLIEQRANLIWRAKGCPSGTALRDWLEAEHEVDAQLEQDRWSYLCRSLPS